MPAIWRRLILKREEGVRKYSLIPADQEYDIVLTPGGSVAINHYQAAKAAYGVIPIIKKGGILILAAHNSDKEPIGKCVPAFTSTDANPA